MRVLAVFLLLLPACQDQQAKQHSSQHSAALEARVQALEAEVQALKAAKLNAPTLNKVSDVTRQAAAQNCALELSRTLELYRQDSLQHRYPQRAEVNVPDACTNQRVIWQKLTNSAYSFEVHDTNGTALAAQKSL